MRNVSVFAASTEIYIDYIKTHIIKYFMNWQSLRKNCPYSEFLRSLFSCIQTEYGDLLLYPHLVGMQKNADQKNSEYEYFLRSEYF